MSGESGEMDWHWVMGGGGMMVWQEETGKSKSLLLGADVLGGKRNKNKKQKGIKLLTISEKEKLNKYTSVGRPG